MPSFSRAVVVERPISEVWEVWTDVRILPRLSSSTVDVLDAPDRLTEVGQTFRQVVRAVGRCFESTWTVTSIAETCDFYRRALGFGVEVFGPEARTALTFGSQKINLHEVGREFTPRARLATAGSGDFCLLTDTSVEEVAAHLRDIGVRVEEGPVRKTGATGPLMSVYFRDPDGNLVEVSNRI